MAESKLRVLPWAEYDELVTHISAQLCTMDLPGIPMETINLSLRDSKISGSVELFEAQVKNLDKYLSIAIVDDICDSGKTLHVLDIHLQDRGHKNIKWCTLLHKTSAMFTPTIIGETIKEINHNDWIVFPWE